MDPATNLRQAADLVFEAADMLADTQAEYHGDRGLGVPAFSPRLERLYRLSAILEEIAAEVSE